MLGTSARFAQKALDAAPDAMIIIDESGVIRFANRQASVLFGHPHDELIGRPVEQLMPERLRALHGAHRQAYLTSPRVRPMGAGLQLLAQRADGTEFPVEISLSPIDDDGRTLVAAAIRDVTDRKRVQADLVHARESADRANQVKSRFLATASHDLRQPLQTLALLNGTLRRTVDDATVTELLAQQEQAIAGMSRLLNALLDISKLESGAIKPDPSDFVVNALFEELRREFAAVASTKGLSFKVIPSEDCVHSDPSLVGQVLRNLVSNAIKYTHKGWVALRCLHERPSFVRIEVSDSGVGIPNDQLLYIYEEFYQVGIPTNTTRDGYGLGLSIVQRIVKLLGLTLEVHSEVGKGSVFALTLPAAQAAARPIPRTATVQPLRASPREAHVLLVEDDAAVRNATRMLLKSDGYHVTPVAGLSEALDHVRGNSRIDLLLTDYHLAYGETGTQVIAAVRQAVGQPLKAVLITGDTSSAIQNLPPDPLMRVASKPVNSEELLRLLRELLSAA
jgi:PAS domain S-box-containing protein